MTFTLCTLALVLEEFVATGALLDPARVNPSVYGMVGAAARSVSLNDLACGHRSRAHGRKSNYANVHVDPAHIKVSRGLVLRRASTIRGATGRIGIDYLSTRKVSGEFGSGEKEPQEAVGASFSCRLRHFRGWCQGWRAWTRSLPSSLLAAWCMSQRFSRS